MQMMNRVKHPNIIKIFGHGNMPNGDHFIVMEFMDSESLDKGVIISNYL
jgi:serine/threonine protein kinase